MMRHDGRRRCEAAADEDEDMCLWTEARRRAGLQLRGGGRRRAVVLATRRRTVATRRDDNGGPETAACCVSSAVLPPAAGLRPAAPSQLIISPVMKPMSHRRPPDSWRVLSGGRKFHEQRASPSLHTFYRQNIDFLDVDFYVEFDSLRRRCFSGSDGGDG
ncbi:3-hydroxy-3-methylglutaryl-coenzyme A reductase2 [Striga asiatica]|uniref:3-hydroxy-3-methylglutaryl-coenzyme A reductase2 n=1 Tax=Striga asiatica TaxID=4170 RepID=A0A5A7RE05_STRAF|nr:3-hydroxy-3-methylglutaryl-coenzyme A reductase2 [Striga asiatica]